MRQSYPLAGQRGDAILQALETAAKQKDKFRDSGSLSYGSGVPDRSESSEFSEVGNMASFRREVDEAPDYFYNQWLPKADQFEQRAQYFA